MELSRKEACEVHLQTWRENWRGSKGRDAYHAEATPVHRCGFLGEKLSSFFGVPPHMPFPAAPSLAPHTLRGNPETFPLTLQAQGELSLLLFRCILTTFQIFISTPASLSHLQPLKPAQPSPAFRRPHRIASQRSWVCGPVGLSPSSRRSGPC